MAAQRVRSEKIKSCRCKSQVLQGYYNSENFVATAAGLFAGRFLTLKYLSRRRRKPSGRRICTRLAQLPHSIARAQSQSLARRGSSLFLRNEYFAIEEKRKGRAKPASPHVMSPDFHCARLMRTQHIAGYRKSRHGKVRYISGAPPPPLRRKRPRRAEKIKLQPHLKALASILWGLLVFQSACGCAPVFIPCLNRNQTSGAQSVFGTFRGKTRLNITRPQPAIFKWF